MNAELAAGLDASLAAMLKHVGQEATFTPKGGAAVPCEVSIAELADDYIQRRYGHDRARMADVLVRRAVVADGRHGDVLAVPAGSAAGTWVVLGVERRDEVSIVLRVRFDTRVDAAAPGSREVRR